MTRNVLTVACMNKLETNNFECFEMIFFKPNNMPLSFASQNFILKYGICRHLNKLKQLLQKKEVWKRLLFYHDYEASCITIWEKI